MEFERPRFSFEVLSTEVERGRPGLGGGREEEKEERVCVGGGEGGDKVLWDFMS
jgi:hypothetical protein